MSELFIKASRLKLRFSTRLGMLGVEDLWDLPLTTTVATKVSLDQIAMETHVRLGAPVVTSFVNKVAASTPQRQEDELRMGVLTYIIDVRKAENEAGRLALAKAEEKRKLLNILAKKQEANLENLSEEEVIARLNAM